MGQEELSDRVMKTAVRDGDVNALKELVAKGADPNAKDCDGYPILLCAAKSVGVLRYLLEDVHLPIESCDKCGYTPFLRASSTGNLEAVQYLVSAGANILARTALGETALHLSAHTESVKTFKFLQESGVPMDILDIRGRTVLHHAAQFSCPSMVEYILQGGWWPVDCQDKNGQTPLMLTADFPRNERDGITYIHWLSSQDGYVNQVIKLLLGAGANLSMKDVLGRTALHRTLGNRANFKFLWEKCPEFTHSIDKKGQTPVQRALLSFPYHWEMRHVVIELLEAGADFRSHDEHGKTALSWATELKFYDIVKALLKTGAETSSCDKETLTQILHLASWKDDFELTNRVIAEGAVVNGRSNHRNEVSTEKGHTARCLRCYTAGGPVYYDLSGQSPLFGALHNLKMVRLLIDAGASVNFKDDHGCSPFHTALERGHREVLDVLLDAGGDPNTVDVCGVSILHTIVSRNVVGMVNSKPPKQIMRFTERLIGTGANINIKDHQDRTPLHYAAVQVNNEGIIRVTEKLIEAGVRVDVADKHGRTPLHYAAEAGNYKFMEVLIKVGADVDATDVDGATPLLMQTKRNYCEVTQLLLAAGADLTASDKNGRRVIHIAFQVGSTAGIDYLMDIWPSTLSCDNQGNTILHFVTRHDKNRLRFIEHIVMKKLVPVDERNVEEQTPLAILLQQTSQWDSAQCEIETLLAAGANPTTKDKNGNTPLHIASSVRNVKAMELLIRAGTDYTLKDVTNQTHLDRGVEGVVHSLQVRNHGINSLIDQKNNEGQTPLMVAVRCSDAVSLLLREGASVTVKDYSGKTPLQAAIDQGNHRAVRLLWAAGSNFQDISEESRIKAVHLAVTSGDVEVLEHLISLGIHLSSCWWDPDHKTTLLHCAAKCGVEMLKYLTDRGHTKHVPDYKGRTALHNAVLSLNYTGAKYLLEEAHVSVDDRDDDGMTALMLVASKPVYYGEILDMFEILVNAGADITVKDRDGRTLYQLVESSLAGMAKEVLDYMQYRP